MCLYALPATAQEEASATGPVLTEESILNWTLVVAIALTATHVSAPYFRKVIVRHEEMLSSFGGGMAAGYVFLHLMSELDAGHELVGRRIHLFVLAGFVLYYGLEFWIERKKQQSEDEGTDSLACLTQVSFGWVYSWLIIYSFPETLQQEGLRVVPVLAALVLHLQYGDCHLGREFPTAFDRWGRFVLASAPLIGWAGDLYIFADNPAVSDLLLALLAGSVIYNLVKHELPEHRKSDFVWFLIGILVFLMLDFASDG